MREERLEVSVTFDDGAATSPTRPSCGQPSWRSAWAACAARSRSRCCLMTSASCQLDGLAERERHRRRAQLVR